MKAYDLTQPGEPEITPAEPMARAGKPGSNWQRILAAQGAQQGGSWRDPLSAALMAFAANAGPAARGERQDYSAFAGGRRRQAQAVNQTAQWLAQRGRADLAEAVALGAVDPKSAVIEALKTQTQEPVKGVEVGGKLVNPITGEVIYSPGEDGDLADIREFEAKGAGLYARARQSNSLLYNLDEQGTDFLAQLANSLPGLLGRTAGNMYLSRANPEFQQYAQAQRDFINAVLRRESGAVISDEEFDNARQQYFPQPGDTPAVIEQKRRNREDAVEGLRVGAGRAAPGAERDPLRGPTRDEAMPAGAGAGAPAAPGSPMDTFRRVD